MSGIRPWLVDHADEHKALRRKLHSHPELGYEEFKTSDLIAAKLSEWGIQVDRGLAGTGIVGILTSQHCAAKNKSVGIRAEMDALSIAEKNTFDHASVHDGKMHACGHDGHIAMVLAAAHYLAETRNFDGTVYFVFQPAEEGGAGAARMIKDGLFAKYPMDCIFALHNWPGLEAGDLGTVEGPIMASHSELTIVIKGKGSHAAMPHLGIDPVVVACQTVMAIQAISGRSLDPSCQPAVISITKVQAGTAMNIIPDEAILQGTIRTYNHEVLDLIEEKIRTITTNTAAAFGATADVSVKRSYPATINPVKEARFFAEVMRDTVGSNRCHFNSGDQQLRSFGAEDFSFYLEKRPGCYGRIGNGSFSGTHRETGCGSGLSILHQASYDFNDELIPVGASVWVNLVEKYLEHTSSEN